MLSTVTARLLLEQLRSAVGRAPSRALFCAAVAAVLGAGALARYGTPMTRGAAAACLLAVGLWLLGRGFWLRRREQDELRALRWVFADTPEQRQKLTRAYLLNVEPLPETSAELATLHYERLVARMAPSAVGSRAATLRRRWNLLSTLAIAASVGLLLRGSHWLVEGYNVLGARDGVAPWPMEWLDYSNLTARSPGYLGNQQAHLTWESAAGLPQGATISVRGRPLWEGVRLVLSNGTEEVPFIDDGDGALVAHWELRSDVELRVAARFGDVLIVEPSSVQVHAMPDQLPRVGLAGAPTDVPLDELTQLELQWRAIDDHQVSQVDLVLRSGGKEERRTLDRPSPGTRQVSGGHLLYPDDPFIANAFLPVVVRVEAKDNFGERDRETWGRSEAFVLRPGAVGAGHVARFNALRHLRDELTDLFAAHRQASASAQATPAPRATELRNDARKTAEQLQTLRSEAARVASAAYAGLAVSRGLASFLDAQLSGVEREFKRPGASPEQKVRALEAALLGLDAGLGSLASRDAREVAKSLGDVADEAAFAARQAQEGEAVVASAQERLTLAIRVLEEGAGLLRQLGTLGNDLGLVARADLDRVQRSQAEADFYHAELAALHLAGRLHRPNPSFGSKGGGGGSVESGNGEGGEGGDPSGKASDADEAFDRLARDLAQLAQEHSEVVDRTSGALDSADEEVRSNDLAQDAKVRAQNLRRAVLGLPEPGEAPSTSRASAALAREHTGGMAHDFDNLDFEQAVESGRRAKSAAEDALRRADLDEWTTEHVTEALDEIKRQLQWATEQRDAWQKRREQAARAALSEVSKAEQELGERARRLSGETSSQAQLPEQTRQKLSAAEELMRQAALHLSSGRGQSGLNLQRQAQRLLEESQPGQTTEPAERQAGKGQRGRNSGFGGSVPEEERKRQAEDFRRRVLEGLARSDGGKLGPAVKRYAEGLLR